MFEKIQSRLRWAKQLLIAWFSLMLIPCSQVRAQPCPVTWGPTLQISNTPRSAFEPQLAVVGDTVHVVYYAGAMYYRRSIDRGKTWGVQMQLVPDDSMPAQIWNRPFAAAGANLYFVYGNRSASGAITSVKIRQSTDGGESWLEPQVLVVNQAFPRFGSPMVATADSMVYVIMLKYTNAVWQWFLTRSSNYGVTWDSIRQVTFGQRNLGDMGDLQTKGNSLHFVVGGEVLPSGREIVYMVSTNRGWTWNDQQVLSTIDNYQAWEPQMAVDDISNVYVCYQDAKYGSIGGFAGTVLMRRSTDNGQSWLPEVRVTPVPAANGSSIALSGSIVHVGFGDERNGFQDATARYTASTNRGETWCNEVTLGGPLRRALSASVAATPDRVYAFWSSDRSDPYDTTQIFMRRGDVITGVVDNDKIVPRTFTVSPFYPNPFNPVTNFQFSIPNLQFVSITIHDILGREVATLVSGEKPAGSYEIAWRADGFPSGVYYCMLQVDGAKAVRKALLLK